MTTLFPSATLPFDALLEAIGPDPEPMPDDAEAKIELKAELDLRWERARMIYETDFALNEDFFRHAAEFVSCFGVFHQQNLFAPLSCEWKLGNWSVEGFGPFLRAMMQQGGHTSCLLDELSVSELVEILSQLPKACLMTPRELTMLETLPEEINIFRGGWGWSPPHVVERSVSWTLDAGVAEEFVGLNFASFGPGQRPFHIEGFVNKTDVIAYFEGEDELIIDPRVLLGWNEVSSRKVIQLESLAKGYLYAREV